MLNGSCQVVLISPEYFCVRENGELLLKDPYRANFVGSIIDEAHCVKKW